MASGATKMAVIGNMHMDIRVIEVTEFIEAICDLRGCLEAAMVSEVTRVAEAARGAVLGIICTWIPG